MPKEPEKDTQLQYALSFLRGTATGETVAKPATPQPWPPKATAETNKSTVSELRTDVFFDSFETSRWALERRPSSAFRTLHHDVTSSPPLLDPRRIPALPYRPCVGIMVLSPAWQDLGRPAAPTLRATPRDAASGGRCRKAALTRTRIPVWPRSARLREETAVTSAEIIGRNSRTG